MIHPSTESIRSDSNIVRLHWLRHAAFWLIIATVSLAYIPKAGAATLVILGAVITAYWEREPQLPFVRMAAIAVRHCAMVGLVVMGYYLLLPVLMAPSNVVRSLPTVVLWGLNLGFLFALGVSAMLFIFYLLTWLAQQAWSRPQPFKSLPILTVLSVVAAAAVHTHETIEQAPEKVRATNQELCARGEAPFPDPRQPLLSTCAVHPGEISTVRFTRDGQSLISAGAGGYRVWNLSDQTLRTTISGEHVGNVPRRVLLSADEHSLLTPTGGQPYSVTVWDLLTGDPTGQYSTSNGDTLSPLGFGIDNRTILTFSKQQGLIVWDLSSRAMVLTQSLTNIEFCAPYPSPTLRFIAVTCDHVNRRQEDGRFYVWDSQSQTILTPTLRVPQISGIEFSDDDWFMAIGTGGGPTDFDFYETNTWTQFGPPSDLMQLLRQRVELARGYGELFWLPDPRPDRKGYRTNAYRVALSRDGTLKALYPEGPYNLRLVDMRTGQDTDLCPSWCYGGSPILDALEMSPDQRWLAAVHGGGISLWDLRTRQLMPSIHGLPQQKKLVPKAPPLAQEPPPPRQTLIDQCAKDVAEACYEEGLTMRTSGKFTEAELLLEKACRLRGSYCVELAKVSAKESNQAGELRWLKAACQQRERQGCQQWMYAAERAKDETGIRDALFGRCRIDGEYCPSLLASADKNGTTPKLIDEVCQATIDGCMALGGSLEKVHRLVHATLAYQRACARGHARACERKDEVAVQLKKGL